jgi:hypothetical protein
MDAWQTEFERLQRHRSILKDKLTIPSNPATVASLQKQLNRVDFFLRRHQGAAFKETRNDPWEREQNLKGRIKRYGRYMDPERKQAIKERIREAREDQEAEDDPGYAAVLKKLRKPPTVESAQKGIEVCIKYARATIESARIRGDAATMERETARIGRLEQMIVELPGLAERVRRLGGARVPA